MTTLEPSSTLVSATPAVPPMSVKATENVMVPSPSALFVTTAHVQVFPEGLFVETALSMAFPAPSFILQVGV